MQEIHIPMEPDEAAPMEPDESAPMEPDEAAARHFAKSQKKSEKVKKRRHPCEYLIFCLFFFGLVFLIIFLYLIGVNILSIQINGI